MREIKFEYGFKSINGIIKKVYELSEIPNIAAKCDLWNELPIAYVRTYTGLKDKNGKDIYEGDVDSLGRVIEYRDGAFHVVQSNGQTFDYLSHMKHITIIGNIYEL